MIEHKILILEHLRRISQRTRNRHYKRLKGKSEYQQSILIEIFMHDMKFLYERIHHYEKELDRLLNES